MLRCVESINQAVPLQYHTQYKGLPKMDQTLITT